MMETVQKKGIWMISDTEHFIPKIYLKKQAFIILSKI